jgi:hypothetical protein
MVNYFCNCLFRWIGISESHFEWCTSSSRRLDAVLMMASDICECETLFLCIPTTSARDPLIRQLPTLERTLRLFQFERVNPQVSAIDSHLLYGVEC